MYIYGIGEEFDVEVSTRSGGLIFSPQMEVRYSSTISNFRRGIIEKTLNIKNDNKI